MLWWGDWTVPLTFRTFEALLSELALCVYYRKVLFFFFFFYLAWLGASLDALVYLLIHSTCSTNFHWSAHLRRTFPEFRQSEFVKRKGTVQRHGNNYKRYWIFDVLRTSSNGHDMVNKNNSSRSTNSHGWLDPIIFGLWTKNYVQFCGKMISTGFRAPPDGMRWTKILKT